MDQNKQQNNSINILTLLTLFIYNPDYVFYRNHLKLGIPNKPAIAICLLFSIYIYTYSNNNRYGITPIDHYRCHPYQFHMSNLSPIDIAETSGSS